MQLIKFRERLPYNKQSLQPASDKLQLGVPIGKLFRFSIGDALTWKGFPVSRWGPAAPAPGRREYARGNNLHLAPELM